MRRVRATQENGATEREEEIEGERTERRGTAKRSMKEQNNERGRETE